jgi:branched-chain amino acid transport system permease protein
MGSVSGAAIAGLVLGVAESLTSAYIANGARDAVGFIMVIVVLLFWPKGIFGRAVDRS